MNINYYLVIEDTSLNVWERSSDFSNDGDYFDMEIDAITKDNILTWDEAVKLKDELDREIASSNNLTFRIVRLGY